MADNIVQFPHARAVRQPIAQFIRLGDSGHVKLAAIHAIGGLPAKRVVVDASRFRHQRELVDALKASGAEIVLDTKAAELAAPMKAGGFARHAPWANEDRSPLGPKVFKSKQASDIYGSIARFAVEHEIDAVLAPTHFLGDKRFGGWLDVDRVGCLALRSALDREGGQAIAIDYTLILPHTWLNDAKHRGEAMDGLIDLPFDNLWIRASGFGQDAGPLVQRRYISSLTRFHNIGKPLIIDYIDGLAGAAAAAFGAAAGIAHGIGERGRFDARQWHNSPIERDEDGSFGRATRVVIPSLDRSLTVSELRVLASARGAKRLIACNDRACCPHGVDDMIRDHKKHAAYQSMQLIAKLNELPDLKRAAHFVSGPLADCASMARRVKDLKPSVELAREHNVDTASMMNRLTKHSQMKDKIYQALEHLLEDFGQEHSRSKTVQHRIQRSESAAGKGGRR